LSWGYDADVFAFCTDQPDFRGADTFVDTGAGIALGRCVVGSAGYGFVPSIADVYAAAIYSRFTAVTTADLRGIEPFVANFPLETRQKAVACGSYESREGLTGQEAREFLLMKNLIVVIVLVAAAAVAYFVFTGQEAEEPSAMKDAMSDAAEAATEAAESAVEAAGDAAEEAGAAVEAVTEAAEGAVEATTEAVEGAADAATEAAEGAVEAATEAASEAVEGATDAVTEAATEAAEGATETATEAVESATEEAGSMMDLLTPEGFDFDKVVEMVDGSDLDPLKKTTLKTALESAKDNPELLSSVLDQIKGALGL